MFFSSETARAVGMSADEAHGLIGKSLIVRTFDEDYAEIVRVTEESGIAWMQHNVPIMRRYLEPGDPDFDEVLRSRRAVRGAGRAGRGGAPRLARHGLVPARPAVPTDVLGDQHQAQLRINDDTGRLIGVLYLYRGTVRRACCNAWAAVIQRLFERMDRVSEPARRPAAILFADLEASGALSRRLSSRGYFDLIRDLTDLIDSSVVANDGIVGKHAGDGGSALFLAADFDGSESAAARAAIDAARAIRDGAEHLGPDDVAVKLNIGVHWGATLMVGQVATRGRLEVTALGDQMNEGARIEAVAKDGAILASKDLIERLDAGDAQATGLDPTRSPTPRSANSTAPATRRSATPEPFPSPRSNRGSRLQFQAAVPAAASSSTARRRLTRCDIAARIRR